MRTEDQVKRKLNELVMQQRNLRTTLSPDEANSNPHLQRIEDMIAILEWVLNAPSGSYHS